MIVIHFSVYGVEVAFFSKSDIPDSFPTMTRGNNPVNNNATTKIMTNPSAINAQVFCLLSVTVQATSVNATIAASIITVINGFSVKKSVKANNVTANATSPTKSTGYSTRNCF